MGVDSLTVVWSPPDSDGGATITSYDLRHILSSALNKADDQWTLKEDIWSSGITLYQLTNLSEETRYDIQIRTGNTEGDGGWSETLSQSTGDLSESCLAFDDSFDDPLFACQWHLKNTGQYGGAGHDINVESAWTITKGTGIHVAIVDDGMHVDHEDLSSNVDSSLNHDYHGRGLFNPSSTHGTSVAGIIAADDNEHGIRGVAPDASIHAYNINADPDNLIRPDFPLTRDLTHTAVSNNSYGFDAGGRAINRSDVWENAIERGITQGFGGKGISYVFSGGNGAQQTDDSNLNGRTNHYGVIAVCAVDYNDRRANYSEKGANLWLCAPSSGNSGAPWIWTTENGGYTTQFGGTSAAAAIVSGVVALVRAANVELTWRDVKLILAASARKSDSGNTGWEQGGLKYGSTSDRYSFNHEYGFGVVDAGAAVGLAADWNSPPALRQITATSDEVDLSIPEAPDSGSPTTVSTSVKVDKYVGFTEFVAVTIDMEHTNIRNLEIELVSPTDKVSRLASTGKAHIPHQGMFLETKDAINGEFDFGSAKYLGEDSAGTWTLRITDRDIRFDDTGTLRSWSLTVYGHGYSPGYSEINGVESAERALTVSWNAPDDTGGSDVTGYDLRYIRSDASDKGDSMWTQISDLASDTGSHVITGLGTGLRYDIQVRATNDADSGPWSAILSQSTNPGPPSPPEIASLVAQDGELHVSWTVPVNDGGAEVSRYDLRYIRTNASDKSDSNWTLQTGAWSQGSGTLVYTIGSLDNDVSYDVQARAANSLGVSNWSGPVSDTPFIANNPPAFDSDETGLRSVTENTSIGSNVGRRVAAIDPNGDQLTYGLVATSDLFEVLSGTGQLRTKATLDHDTSPTHVLMLSVTDGKDSNDDTDMTIDDTITVTVTVTNVNEPPVITGVSTIDEYNENGTGDVATYTAVDPEGDRSIIWSLGGPDRGEFDITGGVLTFKVVPDYERPEDSGGNNHYDVTVQATDSNNNRGELHVDVIVRNVDEPPIITGPDTVDDFPENASTSRQVARYTASDPERATVTLSLTGTDSDDFTLASNGVLTFNTSPDYEDQSSYSVTVRAEAGIHTGNSATRKRVTVNLQNVEERGTVTLSAVQPQERTGLTATLDDDDDPTGITWQWYRTSSRGSTGTAITSATFRFYTPVADDVGSYLRAVASYDDGHGTGKTASAVSANRVQAAPPDPEPPVFPADGDYERSIRENTRAGTNLGAPVRATDANNDRLTYSIPESDYFEVDASSGQLRTKAELDHEDEDEYTVTVTATDPGGGTGAVTVTITVTDVNEGPEVSGRNSYTVEENQELSGADFFATDPEGDSVARWSLSGTDQGDFNISQDGELTFRNTPNYESPADSNRNNEYLVTVRASDGQYTGMLNVTVTVRDVNEAPVLDGPDTVDDFPENASTSRQVARYTASDPERATVTLSLTGTDSDDFTLASNGVLTFNTSPDYEDQSSYSVTVRAEAGIHTGNSATRKRVTVNLQNVEERGTVTLSAVQPQERTGLTATLDDDDDPTGITWQWYRTSSRGSTGTAITSATFRFYTPVADDVGSYLRAVASYDDGHGTGKTASAVSANRVQAAPPDPEPPVFPADGDYERSIRENTRAGTNLGAPVRATDANNDRLTYSIPESDYFEVDASSGQLRTKAELDHEDEDEYTVTVTATDPGGGTGAVTVTITVTDVNEGPEVSGRNSYTVEENQELSGADFFATDPEGDSVARWSLSGTDQGDFNISQDGELTFRNTPNYESPADSNRNNEYLVTVRASDGQYTGMLNVTVTVRDVNEAPVLDGPDTVDDFPENASTSRQVARYTASDPERATVTLSLTGTDSDDFTLASNGVLTFNTSPDYEDQSSYSVTVRAEAGIHTGNSATRKRVTVNLQNVEERGTVTLSAVQPQERTGLTATLDDDDDPTGITWQWYRTSSRGSTGTAITSATFRFYTPVADDVGSYLRAVASYDDGHGTGKTASAVSANRVQAAPPDPEPPVFPVDGNYDRSIRENTRAGTNLGAPVRATDGNNDRLTYSIPPSIYFEIDVSTGQLRTKAELDHEDEDEYTVTVTATDPGGGTGTVTVTITVTDVNEGPEVSGRNSYTVEENQELSGADFFATDPEGDSVARWSLSGTDQGDFNISQDGELTFRNTPNYESPADSNRNNEYLVTVRASDGQYTGMLNVAVTVRDENEAPEFTSNSKSRTSFTYTENSTHALYTYQAADPEGGDNYLVGVGHGRGRFRHRRKRRSVFCQRS